MPVYPPSVDPTATIAPTAIVDEYPIGHSTGTLPPPTFVGPLAKIGHLAILYAGSRVLSDAVVGDRCTVRPHAEVKAGAVLGDGCYLAEEAVVGKGAVLGPGCVVGEGCGVGTGAKLEAGVMLLERTRLPMRDITPAMVGAGAKIGGGAVICGGNKVGKRAVVGAGEIVEDDVPNDATWMGGGVYAVLDEREW